MMSDRNTPIRVGLIGCGRVAETRHLPALRQLPEAQVVAVADVAPERLERVAKRFRVEHRFTDFRAMLDDPDIEAVAVCVPAQFHVMVALAVLETGKHLLIEKPLALTPGDSERLLKQAARSSCKMMVGFNLRWHRLVREARELLRLGNVGPPELIRTVLTSGSRFSESAPEWTKRRELGGGVLFEQAVHHFDLWRFLLQTEVEDVFATSRSVQGDDEVATVTARMTNGVLAASVFSQGTSDRNDIEVYGKAGSLHILCYRFDGLEFLRTSSSPGDVRTRLRRLGRVVRDLPQAAWQRHRGGNFAATYRAEWRHFITCIREDAPVECTLEDGHRALEIAWAAVESASRGQPVNVAEASRSRVMA